MWFQAMLIYVNGMLIYAIVLFTTLFCKCPVVRNNPQSAVCL